MTPLTKPVSRLTQKRISGKAVVLTIAPAGGTQEEVLIGLRLKGQRTQYVCALSDVYRMAALWHGQKEAKARKAARATGTPWRIAKRQFLKEQSIQRREVAA